ncbi:MAG: MotA/TolQ/ExbB proton channel family protein [Marinagarivorans sp.]
MFAFSRRLTLGLFLLTGAISVAQADVNDQLVQRITQSKNELDALEKKNSQESRSYAQRLEQKEQELKALRTQVASQQRVVDEQLLGLDKLKERVDQWSAQSQYQKQLLNHFGESTQLLTAGSVGDDASILDRAEKSLENALNPQWRGARVVTLDAKIVDLPQLALGPVVIGVDTQANQAGPVAREKDQEAHLLGVFSSVQQKDLLELKASGSGILTFDPTLGSAYKLLSSNDGLMTHLILGGTRVVPIIIFGFLAFVVSILKGIELVRLPKIDEEFIAKVNALAVGAAGDLIASKAQLVEKIRSLRANMQGAQAKLIDIVLSHPESQYRDDLMAAYLIEYRHRIERFMGVVATSAAVAPLLGLLGTVSGMISMFKMMMIFGSGDISTVSGGISEALITTELGLVVAIPSLVVSALLARKTKSYNGKLETFAIKLSKMDLSA